MGEPSRGAGSRPASPAGAAVLLGAAGCLGSLVPRAPSPEGRTGGRTAVARSELTTAHPLPRRRNEILRCVRERPFRSPANSFHFSKGTQEAAPTS